MHFLHFHPLCNFLNCFPWKTEPNYLEFPHCFACRREVRPITLDSHPLCNFPRCLWGSSSSFHPLSILPKSFQGKCGKVLEMPSLEKFLEWLLRKQHICIHCATPPPLCVELWSRSLNAFPSEKFVKLSCNFHPLSMNIYEATWFSCIPWDCCRSHIVKAI
ncbi:hypothetical protein BDL97_12G084600 [Sphagnum fallax]|nr:hypothetical protein BDL97_12G084600 [Sphagnum fallax]